MRLLLEAQGWLSARALRFFCDKGGRFERVFFEPRSSALTPAAKRILRKQAFCLKRNNLGAILHAGADFYETSKRKGANFLSAQRMTMVKKFFVSEGLPPQAIKTINWRPGHQATDDPSTKERRFNRYVKTRDGETFK